MAESDWMPGLVRHPGKHAGYQPPGHGPQTVHLVKLHYTVGVDSTGIIANEGLAQFLVPKNGTPLQFAEGNAKCIDACEWNSEGPGIEFERLSDKEPLTDSQISWGGQIVHWLAQTYGVPLTFIDTPASRIKIGTPIRGFVTHRSLQEIACDQHYDYVTQADWDRMVQGADMHLDLEDLDNVQKIIAGKDGPDTPTLMSLDAKVTALQTWLAALLGDAFPEKAKRHPAP